MGTSNIDAREFLVTRGTFANMGAGDVTYDMVLAEYERWREMSGEKQWTTEVMDRVYADFVRTYLRFTCTKRPPAPAEQIRKVESLDKSLFGVSGTFKNLGKDMGVFGKIMTSTFNNFKFIFATF